MPLEVETRLAAAIEHVDLRRVADAVQRAGERDGVVHPQRSDLGVADRRRELVVRHQPPSNAFFMSSCAGFSPTQLRRIAR